MNILEQKKMALRWLGYEVIIPSNKHPGYWQNGKWFRLSVWNPQSPDCPHSVWAEIWGNMDSMLIAKYVTELAVLLGTHGEYSFHTAQPEIKWKALIAVLKQEDGDEVQ